MSTLHLPNKEEAKPQEIGDNKEPVRSPGEYVAPTPNLNPRNQVMKELAEKSNLRADEEATETVEGMEAEEQVEITEPVETETLEASEEPPVIIGPDGTTNTPGFDPNVEYDLIVDGKPMKVRGAQIIERGKQAIQKEIAADYKLELASKLLSEAQAKSQPVQEVQKVDEISDEQLAEIIQFGTKEQAAAAIKMLRAKPEDTQKFTHLAQNIPNIVNDQIAFHEATAFVQSEYKDLLEDPYLKQLFFIKENQSREAGDSRPYKELYKSIGDELRTHFNRQKPGMQTIEEKKEAKRNAPSAPRLASTRMEATEKKLPTREEIIQKMQQARGQRPATTH